MQIAANQKLSCEVPSEHGPPSIRTVWIASDAPYRIIHLEQPAHGRDLLMVEQVDEGEAEHAGVFKIGFQMKHPMIIKSVINDLLLQMRKLSRKADMQDVHQVLYEMGGAYGKPMHRLKEFKGEVVYLEITPECSTRRMTRFARVLPSVETINVKRR